MKNQIQNNTMVLFCYLSQSYSVVNDKPVCGFCSFLPKIAKLAKNIWEPVIENVIILGHLIADTSSKNKRYAYFVKYVTFLLYI